MFSFYLVQKHWNSAHTGHFLHTVGKIPFSSFTSTFFNLNSGKFTPFHSRYDGKIWRHSFLSQGGGKIWQPLFSFTRWRKKIWQPLLVFFSLINFKRCLENEKKYHTYLTLFSSHDSKFLGKFVIYAAFFAALRTWKGHSKVSASPRPFRWPFHVLKAAKKGLVNAGKLFVTRIKPSEVSKILLFHGLQSGQLANTFPYMEVTFVWDWTYWAMSCRPFLARKFKFVSI